MYFVYKKLKICQMSFKRFFRCLLPLIIISEILKLFGLLQAFLEPSNFFIKIYLKILQFFVVFYVFFGSKMYMYEIEKNGYN